jgi:hypothetical protein
VSLTKRLFLFCALAVVVLLGSTVPSEAQGRGGLRVVVGGGFYYSPFLYADPWYGYQYGYPIRPYGYRYAEPDASVRVEVHPKEAGVYVDGYYAGIVDDFDGTFQRLHVTPGEHEIEIWLDGYRTMKQKVYLTRDNTFHIKYQMERLGPGEPPMPKPQPAQGAQQPQVMGRGPAGRRMPPPQQVPPSQYPPDQYPPQQYPPQQYPPQQAPPPPPDNARGGRGNAAYGSLTVKVQPGDAEISIDGEPWRGPGGQDQLVVEVAEGSHTVEIRKPGFRTYVTQVDVRRGQTTPLNVSLRGEQQ